MLIVKRKLSRLAYIILFSAFVHLICTLIFEEADYESQEQSDSTKNEQGVRDSAEKTIIDRLSTINISYLNQDCDSVEIPFPSTYQLKPTSPSSSSLRLTNISNFYSCHYKNICVTSTGYIYRTSILEIKRLHAISSQCCGVTAHAAKLSETAAKVIGKEFESQYKDDETICQSHEAITLCKCFNKQFDLILELDDDHSKFEIPPSVSAIPQSRASALNPFVRHVDPSTTILSDPTLLLDTWDPTEQFGHITSKFVQAASVSCGVSPKLTHVLAPKINPPTIPHLQNIVSMSMALAGFKYESSTGNISNVWFRKKNEYEKYCMKDVYAPILWEEMFTTEHQFKRWKSFLRQLELSPPSISPTSSLPQQNSFLSYLSRFAFPTPPQSDTTNQPISCPPPTIAVLHRSTDTHGLRAISNIHSVLPRVLESLSLPPTYANLTITRQNSTVAQSQLFSSFAILIAPHSSQLKNLIFASESSVVIEVKICLYSKAFEWSLLRIVNRLGGMGYIHSTGHHGSDSSQSPECCSENWKKGAPVKKGTAVPNYCEHFSENKLWNDYPLVLSDVVLDEKVFKKDLEKAIEMVEQRCGNLFRRKTKTKIHLN